VTEWMSLDGVAQAPVDRGPLGISEDVGLVGLRCGVGENEGMPHHPGPVRPLRTLTLDDSDCGGQSAASPTVSVAVCGVLSAELPT
jgi:hypothetical protein